MANCFYAISGPGIVKILILVATILAGVFVAYGFSHSSYMKDEGVLTETTCIGATVMPEGFDRLDKFSCPKKWFIHFALFVVLITAAASLVLFILLLVFELNKNGLFRLLDTIGHMLGFLSTICAGTFCFVFSALAGMAAMCDMTDNNTRCLELRESVFQTVNFSVAGAFLILDAVFFLLAILLIWRDKE